MLGPFMELPYRLFLGFAWCVVLKCVGLDHRPQSTIYLCACTVLCS